jgi:hypothetical protein
LDVTKKFFGNPIWTSFYGIMKKTLNGSVPLKVQSQKGVKDAYTDTLLFKGTVSQDFMLQVFLMNHILPSP